MKPNLESSQAQPVQEIKEECPECLGSGKKSFKSIDELVEYIQKKQQYFDQHLMSIRQYHMDGAIDCPVCNNKGFLTRRL